MGLFAQVLADAGAFAAVVLEHFAAQKNHLVFEGADDEGELVLVALQLPRPRFQVRCPFFLLLPALGGGHAVAFEEFGALFVFGMGSVEEGVFVRFGGFGTGGPSGTFGCFGGNGAG